MAGILKVDTIQNSNASNLVTQANATTITVGASGQTVNLPSGTTLQTDTIKNTNSSTIITQTNSTTITIGTSGQTVALASGASSSGFGATYNGAVNWSSTIRTSGFTAVSGNGYFCNTTSAAFTVTLPASASSGDIIAVSDYAGTFATNNLTLSPNGLKIQGSTSNFLLTNSKVSATFVYTDTTRGWVLVGIGSESALANTYIVATGGTILTCGNYKTHVFTSSGCFVVTNAGTGAGSNSVEYLVVAGGGGGGSADGGGGGGGAGGYRQNYPSPATTGFSVTATTYPITVGGGGAGSPSASPQSPRGTSGSNSIFSTITSTGGGGGGGNIPSPDNHTGLPGGSGGGGSTFAPTITSTGGSGNTPPVSPPQGNNGGTPTNGNMGGGGGGAGASGGTTTASTAGPGGVGSPIADAFFGPTSPSYGTSGPAPGRYFAGGGGGNAENQPAGNQGSGGSGGGASGAISGSGGNSGTTNTGGGGGGIDNVPASGPAGAGGSGIVVIRYKFQ